MFSIETIFWTQCIQFCAHAQFAGVELYCRFDFDGSFVKGWTPAD